MTLASSKGAVTAGTLRALGGPIGVTAKTTASVTNAEAAGTINVSGTALTLGTLKANGVASDLILTASAGAATYAKLEAGRNLTANVRDLMSNSDTVSSYILAGADLTVIAAGLRAMDATAGDEMNITASTQDVAMNNAQAASVVFKAGRSISLSKIQSLIGQVSLEAVRDVTVDQMQAAGAFNLKAGRNATFGTTAACPTSPALPHFYVGGPMTATVTGVLKLVNPACSSINGAVNISAASKVGFQ
jgi:hypothetical protein